MSNLQHEIRQAVDALTISVESIIEDDDVAAGEEAALIAESTEQFKAYVAKLAREYVAKGAAAKPTSITKENNTMIYQFQKQQDITAPANPEAAAELIKLAKSINAGTTENYASKARWYEVIKRLSDQGRQKTETREQGFARYIQTEDGRELFKAYRSASGPDFHAVPEATAHVIKSDSAYGKLKKLAANLCAEQPTLSEHQAFAKVFADPKNRELADLAKREQAFA